MERGSPPRSNVVAFKIPDRHEAPRGWLATCGDCSLMLTCTIPYGSPCPPGTPGAIVTRPSANGGEVIAFKRPESAESRALICATCPESETCQLIDPCDRHRAAEEIRDLADDVLEFRRLERRSRRS